MIKAATIIAIMGVAIKMILSLLLVIRNDAILEVLYYGEVPIADVLSLISNGTLLFFFVTILIKQK